MPYWAVRLFAPPFLLAAVLLELLPFTNRARADVTVPGGIAHAIARCWRPPYEGDEITLRMSFRRDGSVFGTPRITYMKAAGGLDGQAALANSIFGAVAACCPLPFTPSLGAAMAGRILLIRFVAPRRERRADSFNHRSS